MLELNYIIENSGDSNLENYDYSGGILTIALELGEISKKVIIRIRTEIMSFQNYYLDKPEDYFLRTCRIEIQELSSILSIENGIYVPSKDFGKIMNETRLSLNLSYGKRVSEFKYIFSLVGYDRLITCIVSDLDCIDILDKEKEVTIM